MPRPLGYKLSPEARARISAARIALLADPYERARISNTQRTTCAQPDVRQRKSKAATIAQADERLATLAAEQRADYRRLRNGGFRKAEILEALGVAA